MSDTIVPALLVGVLVLLLGAAAIAVARAWTGAVPTISPRALFAGYLYVIVLASTVIVVTGVGQLASAGLAAGLGREFSYPTWRMSPEPIPPRGTPGEVSPEEWARQREFQERSRLDELENRFRDELAQGIAAVLIGGAVGLAHALAKARLRRREDGVTRFLDRADAIIGLALFSILGLTFLVTGIYGLVRFLLFPQVGETGAPVAPGQALGNAIAFVPVWMYRLRSFLRMVDRAA